MMIFTDRAYNVASLVYLLYVVQNIGQTLGMVPNMTTILFDISGRIDFAQLANGQ